MNRPRLSLGLESSRATLNAEACARLGRELAEAREAQKLQVRDVAARLLLSPTQVLGLEHAKCDAFYSADFYASATRKYAALLGLQATGLDDVLVRPDAGVDQSGATAAAATERHGMRAPGRPLSAALVIATSVLVGWWLVSHGAPDPVPDAASTPATLPTMSHLVSSALPRMPVGVTLSPPVRPEAGQARRTPDDRFGHIRVARTTWVFVRYSDNSTVERVLAPGERLVLAGEPIYLAAGAAPGARVVLVGQEIDTRPFTVNGQLRIGAAFLSAAVRP